METIKYYNQVSPVTRDRSVTEHISVFLAMDSNSMPLARACVVLCPSGGRAERQ
ncbi:MAG: hypothetical protein M1531_01605 [Chloroflexi bacterium]|nr:hypothetical protein [Chloroflexota bacterium]